MTERDFAEALLQKYSRKIFAFALAKTWHQENAKDLSQEILTALFRSLSRGKQVDNMDAWVHTICSYTWNNYLIKERRHWRNVDVYERKSMEEISRKLGIPAGTVKWHLFEVRKKLKERLCVNPTEMNLSYKPVRLMVGHCGSPGPNNEPNSYFTSLLPSNICAVIYKEALTVEEIARRIHTASAFVEDELSKLERSDLVRNMGKGRYRTNFIIEDMESKLEIAVPFLNGSQYAAMTRILDEVFEKSGIRPKLEQVHEDMVRFWRKHAPSIIGHGSYL